jgi:sporulation and spore germination protein
MSRRILAVGSFGLAAVALFVLLFVGLPRWYGRRPQHASGVAAAPAPAAPARPGRKIKARLFYIAEDGMRLTSVERDIPYGEGTLEQAREIVAAQLAPVAEPIVSAVPAGTTVRAVFVTDKGEAFVDLSKDVVTAHPGGTQSELLTIYSIVNAVTENLPAVTAVQLLVDGKEVETLAGHVDLRRPLTKNVAYVQEAVPAATKEQKH